MRLLLLLLVPILLVGCTRVVEEVTLSASPAPMRFDAYYDWNEGFLRRVGRFLDSQDVFFKASAKPTDAEEALNYWREADGMVEEINKVTSPAVHRPSHAAFAKSIEKMADGAEYIYKHLTGSDEFSLDDIQATIDTAARFMDESADLFDAEGVHRD